MDDDVIKVDMKAEFKTCPSCGYKDGFHSMFRREGDVMLWHFICPSCHAVFDIGLSLPASLSAFSQGPS